MPPILFATSPKRMGNQDAIVRIRIRKAALIRDAGWPASNPPQVAYGNRTTIDAAACFAMAVINSLIVVRSQSVSEINSKPTWP